MQTQVFTDSSSSCLPSDSSRFELKITQDQDELKLARKLRLNGHYKEELKASKNKKDACITRKLMDQHQNIIHDGYDSYAQHLIIKDLRRSKIIAYIRMIDAFTAFKIGGFYCETQFNVQRMFSDQKYYMEISRLVIDQGYDNDLIAKLLWTGITQYALESGVDAIIGSLSIPLTDKHQETGQMIAHFKTKYMSNSKLRVFPYQLLPDNTPIMRFNFASKQTESACLDYFFSQGIDLCGEAHWNKSLNTAELFIHYRLTNTQQIPHCIHMNEVELGLMCE